MLNPHHLELFYYVARHRGISRAVRHMPYGIQQPAVSGQLRQLEHYLGVRLFERAPFALTPAGVDLLAAVEPFFSGLDAVERRLRQDAAPLLRLGASEAVLRNHLPAVLDRLRARFPGLRLELRSGYQPQLEAWLGAGEIDLAVTGLEQRPPARLHRLELAVVGLVLLVPRSSPHRSAEEFLRDHVPDAPLICLPPSESVSRSFASGLKERGCDWPVAIVASSLDVVLCYVASGYGVGVGLALPETLADRRVRALPLPQFPPIRIMALWRGRPTEIVQALLDEAERAAGRMVATLAPAART